MRAVSVTSPALEIRHLTKRYGAHLALDDVDLVVAPGAVVGLVGANGAGKTTLMRIALGLIAADAGTVTIAGRTHGGRGATANGVAGFVDVPRFYPWLSGRHNLELLIRLDADVARRGVAPFDARRSSGDCVERAIRTVGLSAGDARVAQYSAGMRQRLAIAAALLRSPRLLLLDEPTSSLDPAAARGVRTLVRQLAADGVAVVFSSHDMTEVEQLCSLVTVLDHGRVRFCGSVHDVQSGSRHVVYLQTSDDHEAARLARQQPDLTTESVDEDGMEIAGCVESIDRYMVVLGYAGIAVRALERRRRTLETAFLRMTTGAPVSSHERDVAQSLPHDRTRPRSAEVGNIRQRTAATVRGVVAVFQVEWMKLRAQRWIRPVVALCLLGPWAFVLALRVQDGVPEDTLFGRGVRESGLAVPLVVLGFSAMWILPALGALVAGDVFSGEDRHGTWSSILTRSRTRSEMFAGKVLLALSCSTGLVVLLGFSSVLAGLAGVGHQPLVDLSGALTPAPRALVRIAAAWASVAPPVAAFAGLALLISLGTHRSTAGVGLPVVAGLLMQLSAFVNGPDSVRRLIITSAFGGWHGLFNQRPYYGPLIASSAVSLVYCAASIGIGSWIFRKRDVT